MDQKGCQNAEVFPRLSFNEAHQKCMKTEESLAAVAGARPSGDSRAVRGGGGSKCSARPCLFPKVSHVKFMMRNPIFSAQQRRWECAWAAIP